MQSQHDWGITLKRIAIDKATDRLDRARTALASAIDGKSFPDFNAAWTDLLIYLNTIHEILRGGAKGNKKSEEWFGRAIGQRKNDPLLAYLHHARNADEHGLEAITKLAPGYVGIDSTSGDLIINDLVASPSGITIGSIRSPSGGTPIIKVQPPAAKLVAVTDRGVRFDPPTVHLGKAIADNLPVTVGQLGLAFHEKILEEAKKLAS
jgi:hypothetical protein